MPDLQLLVALLEGVPERLESYRKNPGVFSSADADAIVAVIAEWRGIRAVAEGWKLDPKADWNALQEVSDGLMRRLAIHPPVPPPKTPPKNYQAELAGLMVGRQLEIMSMDAKRMITEDVERAMRGLR